jgi:hypothetical protein
MVNGPSVLSDADGLFGGISQLQTFTQLAKRELRPERNRFHTYYGLVIDRSASMSAKVFSSLATKIFAAADKARRAG